MYPPTAICGTFRMHGAHILPRPARFRMHGARILPRTGDFPVRGRFRDAWSAKLATDCRPRTHRGGILPLPVRPRAHQGAIPPPSDAGKRISRAFCHRRAPGNAPWRNIATTSRPRAHSRRSCHGRTPGFAPHQITAALPAKKNGTEGRTWRTPPPEARKTECWRGWGEQQVRRGAAPSPNTRECSAAKYRNGR